MQLTDFYKVWKDFELSDQNDNSKEIHRNGEISLELKLIRSMYVLRLNLVSDKSYEKKFKGINFKGIDFVSHGKGKNKIIDVILLDRSLISPFNGFLLDLYTQIKETKQSDNAVQVLSNTLSTWIKLFKSVNKKGLSEEAQLGLYGELYFLYRLLKNGKHSGMVIEKWTGPDKLAKDFIFDNCSIEIKATKVGAPAINVSSENQLNNARDLNLYLSLFIFDFLPTDGYTLNSIIKEIKELINELEVEEKFEEKLELAGYKEDHCDQYENRSYALRDQKHFIVDEKFPRIIYGEISEGISNVSYSIHPSACSDSKEDFKTILESIW